MIKLTLMLAMPILMLLGWSLALSDASTPMVAHYGVWGCLAFAATIAAVCAWVIVAFIRDLKAQERLK